jgi:hypothetical protein
LPFSPPPSADPAVAAERPESERKRAVADDSARSRAATLGRDRADPRCRTEAYSNPTQPISTHLTERIEGKIEGKKNIPPSAGSASPR